MPGQPADAPGAFIDQTAVALLHTAGAVAVRDVRNRVGLGENIHINRRVLRRPAPRLIAAGQKQEKPQKGTGRAGPQNGLRGERVKAPRAAAGEIDNTAADQLGNGVVEQGRDSRQMFRRQVPVAGKTAGCRFT